MEKFILLYRKPFPGRNSIEGVFRPLEHIKYVVKKELPCDFHSIWHIFRLFVYGLRIKEKNIHITGDVHYMAFLMFWKRTIITIHDCNHYENLKGFKKWLMGMIWFVLPIKASKKVVVISPFVKEQLKEHFNIPDRKIIIIPNSFEPVPILDNIKTKNEDFEILTIGTYPHKNQKRLIESVKDIEGVSLIIVGNLSDELKYLLKDYNIKYRDYFNISRKELNLFYNKSDLLFFASIKEGFGLPILEAQSCNLPVLTSNTASMPYVAGNSACLVDPTSVDEIKSGILAIKNDSKYRLALIEKGRKNVLRFSEEKFMHSYCKIYEEVFN